MTKPTEDQISAQAKLAFDPPSITQQGLLVKLLNNDLEKAAQIAQEYGGKLGTLEQRRPEKITVSTNPWSDKFKGTPAEALAEQTRILRTSGTAFAGSLAKAAGVSIMGAKLK
jgi:hypothetical protein